MVSSRFAVTLHILLLVASLPPVAATSARIAASVNTNPVVVRRIIRQLAAAGLVVTRRGAPGAALARPAAAITLAEVWRAVQGSAPLVALHANPNPDCPVGQRVNAVLSNLFALAEAALIGRLAATSLAALLADLRPEAASAT